MSFIPNKVYRGAHDYNVGTYKIATTFSFIYMYRRYEDDFKRDTAVSLYSISLKVVAVPAMHVDETECCRDFIGTNIHS